MVPNHSSRRPHVAGNAVGEPSPTIDPINNALRAEIEQASCAAECVERGECAALTPVEAP
jgi:hypothetical protein